MLLSVKHQLVSQELKRMERFLALLHTAVSENQAQLDASVAELTSTLSAAEKKDAYAMFLDQFLETSVDFPRLLYSSFVVSWYSVLEHHLLDFCKFQKLRISISVQDNENYGDGVRRAYNFLSRGANYQINDSLWQELIHIGKTRNRLVHNSGKLSYTRSNLPTKGIPVSVHKDVTYYLNIEEDFYRYLLTHHLLEPDHNDPFQLTPSYEYSQHLVKFGLEFFEKLYTDFGKESKPEPQSMKGG